MKVAITTWGSRGDYQPYLALARGFQKAGHAVQLGAPPNPEYVAAAADARIAHRLGVATAPIKKSALTVERLSRSITTAVHDTSMRARAARLGEAVRSEDGVETAVRFVQEHVQSGGRGATGRPSLKSTTDPSPAEALHV